MRFDKVEDILQLAMMMQASYGGISLDDIVETFSVSRRTAERMRDAVIRAFPDVEEMKDPDGRRKRWRLTSRSLHRLSGISLEDITALNVACGILERENMQPQAKQLTSVKLKLEATLDQTSKRKLGVDVEALIEAEGLARRPGPRPHFNQQILQTLRQALLLCEKVEITYTSRTKNDVSVRVISPLGFLYGQRHYLVGLNADGEDRLFSLKNILSASLTGQFFERPKDFSLKEYAARSFGVFQGKLHDIVLQFASSVSADVHDHEFHPNQEVSQQTDGAVIVSFQASGLRELAWHLVTWGQNVSVLSPLSLKAMVEPLQKAMIATPEWNATET